MIESAFKAINIIAKVIFHYYCIYTYTSWTSTIELVPANSDSDMRAWILASTAIAYSSFDFKDFISETPQFGHSGPKSIKSTY